MPGSQRQGRAVILTVEFPQESPTQAAVETCQVQEEVAQLERLISNTQPELRCTELLSKASQKVAAGFQEKVAGNQQQLEGPGGTGEGRVIKYAGPTCRYWLGC